MKAVRRLFFGDDTFFSGHFLRKLSDTFCGCVYDRFGGGVFVDSFSFRLFVKR